VTTGTKTKRPPLYNPGEAAALILAGQRYEFAGEPERALRAYQTAEAVADTPQLRAEATRRVGDAHRARCAWEAAEAAYAESLAIAEAFELKDLAAEALNARGTVAVLQGDAARAEPILWEGLGRDPEPRVRGMLLQNLGMCAVRRGDHARAIELFVAGLACYRDAGYRRGVVMMLINVAAATIEVGETPERALPLLREAASIARDLMDLDLLLLTVSNEAEMCAKLGRLDEAEAHIGEALGHFTNAGNESRRAECLAVLGDIHRAYRTADHDTVAARCYERAAALAGSVGAANLVARANASLAALGRDAAA
jgi:tetratricopeptide (TPR) repeat protein